MKCISLGLHEICPHVNASAIINAVVLKMNCDFYNKIYVYTLITMEMTLYA